MYIQNGMANALYNSWTEILDIKTHHNRPAKLKSKIIALNGMHTK